jgi:hypothetical protein
MPAVGASVSKYRSPSKGLAAWSAAGAIAVADSIAANSGSPFSIASNEEQPDKKDGSTETATIQNNLLVFINVHPSCLSNPLYDN